jgi:hypothetical protein
MAEDGIGVDHGTLYHLVQATLWNASKDSGSKYFPPTYEVIHLPRACTKAF